MENKKIDFKSEKRKSWKLTQYWMSLISALIGILGSIISSLSYVGINKLTSQQIIIFTSIFLGIVIITATFQRIQKMGAKTRLLCKKIEEAYISQLELSLLNREQK